MNKTIGAIFLVAGSAIGSGMIALPIVLSKLGLIPSIFLMIITWLFTYYTSLISLELNIQSGRGLSIGQLGFLLSGKTAGLVGNICIKLLSYALLAVFIYGGSSILQKLFDTNISMEKIAGLYSLVVLILLSNPLKIVDYVNRILFISLLVVIFVLIVMLISMINWHELPLFAPLWTDFPSWSKTIPILFTSFGFQMIFPTIVSYCNLDSKSLKTSLLWGSLIPAIIYILWTVGILGIIYNKAPAFYSKMLTSNIEVGELIKQLSLIAKLDSLQILIWWISSLAIVTSVLGVGLGLCDAIKNSCEKHFENKSLCKLTSSFLTMMPPFFIAILIPNAFITVLGFAGMILVFISVVMPIYLFNKNKITKFNYKELKFKPLILLSFILGLVIMGSEIYNML